MRLCKLSVISKNISHRTFLLHIFSSLCFCPRHLLSRVYFQRSLQRALWQASFSLLSIWYDYMRYVCMYHTKRDVEKGALGDQVCELHLGLSHSPWSIFLLQFLSLFAEFLQRRSKKRISMFLIGPDLKHDIHNFCTNSRLLLVFSVIAEHFSVDLPPYKTTREAE